MRLKNIDIGSVFGYLTVISTYKLDRCNRAIFYVQCICDHVFEVSGTNLRTGRVTSCKSCSFEKRSLSQIAVPQERQLFNRLILERCRKNNIPVSIDVNDYIEICKQDCFYCGNKPCKINHFSKRKFVNTGDIFINGIDRINSSIGYLKSNCVACCKSCNYAKHTLSQEDFIAKIKKIYIHLNLGR